MVITASTKSLQLPENSLNSSDLRSPWLFFFQFKRFSDSFPRWFPTPHDIQLTRDFTEKSEEENTRKQLRARTFSLSVPVESPRNSLPAQGFPHQRFRCFYDNNLLCGEDTQDRFEEERSGTKLCLWFSRIVGFSDEPANQPL